MADQYRLNLSNENLLTERGNSNRVVFNPGHDYLSLISPVNLFDPNNLQILRTYVQSRPRSIRHSISNFYKRHRPRRQKKSREEVAQEFEDVYHRFWKLQIWIGILVVLTIALIPALILLHPRLQSGTSEKGDDLFVGDGDNKSFKLCTKCKPLMSMKGISKTFIADIQSSSHSEFCCFRRVDQILALFSGYAETYVDQEVKRVRDEAKSNLTSMIANSLPRSFPLVHVYYQKTAPTISNEISPLTWETRGVDLLFRGGVKLRSRQRVIVPEPGYYYVYSSLELEEPGSHVKIMKDDRTLLGKLAKGGNSELQGVFRLNKNDGVSVVASNVRGGARSNYFGIYLLRH